MIMCNRGLIIVKFIMSVMSMGMFYVDPVSKIKSKTVVFNKKSTINKI